MRFPALLTAKIVKARMERMFRPAQHDGLLRFADAAEVLHQGSDHPVSHEKVRDTIASAAPVIWIGGSEPLDHPGIAHFVRAIGPSGHYVFVETHGNLLRRRIHEFQPLPRIFLTVRMNASEPQHSALAVEGIRAARLSGFYIAVHTRVNGNANLSELEQLRELLFELDVDGWMITAEAADERAIENAEEIRRLIPDGMWRRFSGWVECELLLREKVRDSERAADVDKQDAENCEEGVRVV
jgi:hypothetical protein